MEDLVEIVHSKEDLIGQPCGENRVPNQGVVIHMQRRCLATLSSEPAEGEALVLGKIMVDPRIGVVAVSGRGNRAKEVVGRGRQVADQVLWPETIRPN